MFILLQIIVRINSTASGIREANTTKCSNNCQKFIHNNDDNVKKKTIIKTIIIIKKVIVSEKHIANMLKKCKED